jgi:hypothetical protein
VNGLTARALGRSSIEPRIYEHTAIQRGFMSDERRPAGTKATEQDGERPQDLPARPLTPEQEQKVRAGLRGGSDDEEPRLGAN